MLLISISAKAQYLKYEPISPRSGNYSNKALEDGWYKAIVQYTNTGTSYKATYNLRVKVSNDNVTMIEFGDGYLHSGINSSGYHWSGGALRLSTDINGNVTSASTTVNIIDKDIAPKVYTIHIK